MPQRGTGPAAADGARQGHHRPAGLRRSRQDAASCSSPARPAAARACASTASSPRCSSRATPDQVQMLMIDPKRVELTVYNGIPHLIKEVITDPRLAAGALFEMTKEMDSRYERFAKAGVRKIEEYNAKFPDEKLPYVVIVIDELADLMLDRAGQSRNDDLPARAARARDRDPSRRRDAAPVGRRHHRHHQGEHSLAHRVRGQLASRFAHDSRHGRRGAAARTRRHALSADRCAQAGARARRAHHRCRGQPARRILGGAGAAREPARRRGRADRRRRRQRRRRRSALRTTRRSSSSRRTTRRPRSCSRSSRSGIRARCA